MSWLLSGQRRGRVHQLVGYVKRKWAKKRAFFEWEDSLSTLTTYPASSFLARQRIFLPFRLVGRSRIDWIGSGLRWKKWGFTWRVDLSYPLIGTCKKLSFFAFFRHSRWKKKESKQQTSSNIIHLYRHLWRRFRLTHLGRAGRAGNEVVGWRCSLLYSVT